MKQLPRDPADERARPRVETKVTQEVHPWRDAEIPYNRMHWKYRIVFHNKWQNSLKNVLEHFSAD